MKWDKMGNVYDPADNDNGYTHGANPFPIHLEDDLYRIYFNVRDKENKSCITYLDYDLKDRKIREVAANPIICPGKPGLFDDSGCSLGCVLSMDSGQQYIYYVGWNLGVTVPWMNYIGLAVYDPKEGTCEKYSNLPIMERNEVDYLSTSYPYVIKEGLKYRMWYGSNIEWGRTERDMNHVIKYAESADGIHWDRRNIVCIKGESHGEYAFSKPSVLYDGGIYKMWYSYRGEKYRIGYAESMDGIRWSRKDELAGINPSDEGWDSEMIDYPVVFRHKEEIYMLYCGNGYGKTGFGLAVCR